MNENPGVLPSFGVTKAARCLSDPDASIRYVKGRDALIDERSKSSSELAIESVIATPSAKAEGVGGANPQRLGQMLFLVLSAFDIKNPVKPEQVFNASFLPPKSERMIFPK